MLESRARAMILGAGKTTGEAESPVNGPESEIYIYRVHDGCLRGGWPVGVGGMARKVLQP